MPNFEDAARNRAVLSALLVLVASVYMVTYSARIESTDTLFMFDATASFVRFGDFRLDLSHGERRSWEYEQPLEQVPLLPVNAEPLQLVLASPLYALADVVPGIGRVHAVWLFNIFVVVAGAGLLFQYATLLGYRLLVATVTTLLYAFGTIVWPYSKTFFQEPLTLLLILLAAYVAELGRTRHWAWWRRIVSVGVCFGLILTARRGGVFAFPAIIIVMWPAGETLFRWRWFRWGCWGVALVALSLLFYATIAQSASEFRALYGGAYTAGLPEAQVTERVGFNNAIRGFLFSPGGSIWGTSPLTLLALPGMLILTARQQMRYVLAAWMLLAGYTFGYANFANVDWFGGLSWPPRFLVPVIPFLMLCVLPVVDGLWSAWQGRWVWVGRVLTGFLVLYSVWVQLSGVSYWWGEYVTLLPPEADGFTEWRGGLEHPRYFRWVLLPQLWGERPLDFAWVRTGEPTFPMIFGALVALSALLLVLLLSRAGGGQRLLRGAALAPVLLFLAIGWGLHQIYMDDLYLAFSEGLHAIVPEIRTQADPDETILIANLGHERFFLNYGRLPNRLISLPDHPGEQPSPDQPPLRNSPNPALLLERPTVQLIDTLAAGGQGRLWVLADSSPFVPWSVLPLERYLSAYHYPLTATETTGPDGLPVRLLSYHIGAQHDPFRLVGPSVATDLFFGEKVRLLGLELPAGDAVPQGHVLPVSLQWMANEALEESYRVALHLVEPGSGVVASAMDSAPGGGFAPTNTWQAGAPVWDNRAITLPVELSFGEYELWVGLYTSDLLPVTGAQTAEDGTLGVLPTRITVTE